MYACVCVCVREYWYIAAVAREGKKQNKPKSRKMKKKKVKRRQLTIPSIDPISRQSRAQHDAYVQEKTVRSAGNKLWQRKKRSKLAGAPLVHSLIYGFEQNIAKKKEQRRKKRAHYAIPLTPTEECLLPFTPLCSALIDPWAPAGPYMNLRR